MNNDASPDSSRPDSSVLPSQLPAEALARRRALLQGLGKGTAVAAALVPIQTLAVGTTVGGRLCTVSGSMSGVASTDPTATRNCSGFQTAHYLPAPTNWPTLGGGNTSATPFNAIFGGAITTPIGDVLAGGPPNSVWVTAYLNALTDAPGQNYPYSPLDVINFFNAPEPLRSDAFAFFSGFMQTVP